MISILAASFSSVFFVSVGVTHVECFQDVSPAEIDFQQSNIIWINTHYIPVYFVSCAEFRRETSKRLICSRFIWRHISRVTTRRWKEIWQSRYSRRTYIRCGKIWDVFCIYFGKALFVRARSWQMSSNACIHLRRKERWKKKRKQFISCVLANTNSLI